MREDTRRWLNKADEDFSDATYNLEGQRLATAAFLAQQAAEKALKAILVERQGAFPRVHDLVTLAGETKAPSELRARCERLTLAYVASRYPDVEEPVSEAQAVQLVADAKEVVAWARRQLS